jgi:hypothetical protein
MPKKAQSSSASKLPERNSSMEQWSVENSNSKNVSEKSRSYTGYPSTALSSDYPYDSDYESSFHSKFKRPGGITDWLAWIFFLSALTIIGATIFVSVCVIIESILPFIAYRANSMWNGQPITYVEPDEQLPGLYWQKSENQNGVDLFYQTGHPDLKCYRDATELLWKDPPADFVHTENPDSIWKFFDLKLDSGCDGNSGKGETPDDWRKRCYAYSWEIVESNDETKTQLYLGKENAGLHPCLEGKQKSFFIPTKTTECTDGQCSKSTVEDVWNKALSLYFEVEDVPSQEVGAPQTGWSAQSTTNCNVEPAKYEDRYKSMNTATAYAVSDDAQQGKPFVLPPGSNELPTTESWNVRILCHQPVDIRLILGVMGRELMTIWISVVILWYEAKEFWGGRRGVWYERVIVQFARILVYWFAGGMLFGEFAIGTGPQDTLNWVLR